MQHRRALFSVVAAQFFSSLADNALLIATIGLLVERHAASWMTPTLRLLFYLAYVLLAVFAGAVADAFSKGRVIWFTNLIKLAGCGLLLAHVHPLLAYTLIGLGAAAYAPAKYGILTELLSTEELVSANAWMEVATLLSILLGVGLASALLQPTNTTLLFQSQATQAVALIGLVYLLALLCAAMIPKSVARHKLLLQGPTVLLKDFKRAFRALWRDVEGRISLAVTSLFWAASAALQFIILRWAEQVLHLPLAQAALLQISVALGMVAGAVAAARWVPLRHALTVLPLGIAIGVIILMLAWISNLIAAIGLLFVTGLLSGLLVVPMNALLQYRGSLLMSSGQAIAVQNFNESLGSLIMLFIYGVLLYFNAVLLPTILGLGVLVSVLILYILSQKRNRQRSLCLLIIQSCNR